MHYIAYLPQRQQTKTVKARVVQKNRRFNVVRTGRIYSEITNVLEAAVGERIK